MPTYEYKCTNGHTFEAFQSITEEALSKCPKCKAAAKRVINGGMGVIFKGSGFYTTDYKKSSALTGGGNGKKPESSSSPDSPSKDSSARDSSSKSSGSGGSSKEKAAAS